MSQEKNEIIKAWLLMSIENARRESIAIQRTLSTAPKNQRNGIKKQISDLDAQNSIWARELASIQSGNEPRLDYTGVDFSQVPRSPAVSPPKVDNANPLANLLNKLRELNGLEVYDPASSPDTPLSGDRMLKIPVNIAPQLITALHGNIGRNVADINDFNITLRIAAVNYESLKRLNHPEPAKVALLRALIATRQFAVEIPRNAYNVGDKLIAKYCKRSEIEIVDDSPGLTIENDGEVTALDQTLDDLSTFITSVDTEEYQSMAILLPIFASIEFQKTNHHYVDNDFYREAYSRHFKSSVLLNLEANFNKASIIYDAVHWMGPFNMQCWKENFVAHESTKIPRGMKIKLAPAPSGTAVIVTQLAVWNAISVYPGTEGLMKRYGPELKVLRDAAIEISQDRLSFHVFASLFGKASRLEEPGIEAALSVAANLAGIAQGFIEAVCVGSDLARAKALKKHAEQNIAIYTISKAAFQGAQQRMKRDARSENVSDVVVKAASRQLPVLPPNRLQALQPIEEDNIQ